MTRLFGTGHIPDAEHVAASLRHVSALIADDVRAGATSPERAAAFIRAVHQQRGSGFCVGHALGQGFAARARALGFEVPEVSALAICRMATPTPNDGCAPYEACSRAMGRGVVADATWPVTWKDDDWTPANDTDELPLDVWEKALDATIKEIGVIDLADRASVDAAIDAGYSVAWSTPVDKQVDDYSGGTLGVPSGTNRGRHYTLLVDRSDVPIGVNSWGTGWGTAWAGFSGGFYRVSYDRLGDSSSLDGRVIRVGPRVLE